MGNDSSKKAFKGQGHVLSGDQQVATERKEEKKEEKKPVTSFLAPKKKSQPKKTPETPEEAAARRAKQQAAAEARNQAWEKQLAKNREKRAKERQTGLFDHEGGTAAKSAEATLQSTDHSKLEAKLDADAKALEQSGFDPYAVSFATSKQARTVLNLDGLQDAQQKDPTQRDVQQGEGASQVLKESSSSEMKAQALATLEFAMASSDVATLENAIKQVGDLTAAGIQDDDNRLKEHLAFAIATLESLKASLPDDLPQSTADWKYESERDEELDELEKNPAPKELAVQAPEPQVDLASCAARIRQQLDDIASEATLDQAGATTALRTLSKVIENAFKNPQEEKYRKLRLTNPAIQNKLVAFGNGAAVNILQEVGFERGIGEEGETVLLLPEEATNVFQARVPGTLNLIQQLLDQLTPASIS